MKSMAEIDLSKTYYFKVYSASKIDKLVRAFNLKGLKPKDIAVFGSNKLFDRVKLYCAFDIKAVVNPFESDAWYGTHKVVITTLDIPGLRAGRNQVLINLDDKESVPNGYHVVYNTYSDKDKVGDKIPYFEGLPNRKWETMLLDDSYRKNKNYLRVEERNVFKYILQMYPEIVAEDVLWMPGWNFTTWNEYRPKIYSAILLLNRTLVHDFFGIETGEHLDFVTTKDGREFNALITLKKQYRETLIYQALTECFTDYTYFDIDFCSCFPNIILKSTGIINNDALIDFKRLTDAGKTITPDIIFQTLGKGSQTTQDQIIQAFEEGGSCALAKVVINAVFNGYGAGKIKNTAQRIEYVLTWLVDYNWNGCNFKKLNGLEWLKKESYYICSRAEAKLRTELINHITCDLGIDRCRYVDAHDRLFCFCLKEEAEKLEVLLSGTLVTKHEITAQWDKYHILLPDGTPFQYKVKAGLSNRLERTEFVTQLNIEDGAKFEYSQKGKFVGKNKRVHVYICPESKYLRAGFYTLEYINKINPYDKSNLGKFKKMCGWTKKVYDLKDK
jgi:hypothetical protein